VPMCQSPKVAEVLLRAKTAPANDNCAATGKRIKPSDPESGFKTTWPTLVILVSIITFFVFAIAGRLMRQRALVTGAVPNVEHRLGVWGTCRGKREVTGL
jgi:hypothetical protein